MTKKKPETDTSTTDTPGMPRAVDGLLAKWHAARAARDLARAALDDARAAFDGKALPPGELAAEAHLDVDDARIALDDAEHAVALAEHELGIVADADARAAFCAELEQLVVDHDRARDAFKNAQAALLERLTTAGERRKAIDAERGAAGLPPTRIAIGGQNNRSLVDWAREIIAKGALPAAPVLPYAVNVRRRELAENRAGFQAKREEHQRRQEEIAELDRRRAEEAEAERKRGAERHAALVADAEKIEAERSALADKHRETWRQGTPSEIPSTAPYQAPRRGSRSTL